MSMENRVLPPIDHITNKLQPVSSIISSSNSSTIPIHHRTSSIVKLEPGIGSHPIGSLTKPNQNSHPANPSAPINLLKPWPATSFTPIPLSTPLSPPSKHNLKDNKKENRMSGYFSPPTSRRSSDEPDPKRNRSNSGYQTPVSGPSTVQIPSVSTMNGISPMVQMTVPTPTSPNRPQPDGIVTGPPMLKPLIVPDTSNGNGNGNVVITNINGNMNGNHNNEERKSFINGINGSHVHPPSSSSSHSSNNSPNSVSPIRQNGINVNNPQSLPSMNAPPPNMISNPAPYPISYPPPHHVSTPIPSGPIPPPSSSYQSFTSVINQSNNVNGVNGQGPNTPIANHISGPNSVHGSVHNSVSNSTTPHYHRDSHPIPSSPNPHSIMNSHLDPGFIDRINDVQETASHLYYFTNAAKESLDNPPKLENLHTLLNRVRFAGDFLDSWYNRLYDIQQQRIIAESQAPPQSQPPLRHIYSNHYIGLEDDSPRRHTRKRARQPTREEIRCHQCGITETPEWRRGPDGARTLCNACGLYHAKLVKKRGEAEAAEILRERRESRSQGDTNLPLISPRSPSSIQQITDH